MKTYFKIASILFLTGFYAACTPAEETPAPAAAPAPVTTPAPVVPVAAPAETPLPPALPTNSLPTEAHARARSIVPSRLLPQKALWELVTPPADTRLVEYLNLQGSTLQESSRAANAQRVVRKTQKALIQLKREMVTSLRASSSSEDAAQRLKDLASRYQAQLNQLSKEEAATAWVVPSSAQDDRLSKQDVTQATQRLLSELEQDYGPVCAQKAKPVVDKAADDYWLAISSLQTPEVIAQTLQQSGQEANRHLNQIIQEYGDPMVSLSEEDISSLRVRLIAAHQKVEKQFETLYGKEAVLQTREIFEPYLKGITPLFESKERISEKQKKLDELGEIYRQKMTQLQGHLNETTDASSVKKETH